MTNSKHTPGPWTMTGNSWQCTTVYDSDGNRVCLLDLEDWGVTEDNQVDLEREQERVALLIAAAPELLEALKLILEHCNNNVEVGTVGERVVERVEETALAAIAKAEG